MRLRDDYDALSRRNRLDLQIPDVIRDNLSSRITLRPYQVQAVARFRVYMQEEAAQSLPVQLLFEMATGSGKTAVMAALIIDLYTRGYRNFIFFVNSTQIVEKTRANFLDANSSKHLFAPEIKIGGERVAIRSVSNFDEAHPDAINIHFTTIHGLHARMLRPRENDMTPEDFEDNRVVLISDEAHHMSAETRAFDKLSAGEKDARRSWEGTVNEIMDRNPENVLLEFTATADLDAQAMRDKYDDRLIYQYNLKDFRADGFSKDIELRQASLPPEERMLQAVVLSQYRRKIAEGHGIRCKPVILMKSGKIAESKENEELFHNTIAKLDGARIMALSDASQQDETLARAFNLVLVDRGMDPEDFAQELRIEFGPEKVVNVNDPKDLEARQILLNTLEDRDNEIRIIFAVDKLNEGWDVLNLFDIVRLYDKRDGKGDKVGKTTMSEAQLIGRGARYYPFIDPAKADDPKDRRKFDTDVASPLRILEQLHYHCSHNPRYIDDIKRALRNVGLYDDTERRVTLKVKEAFRATKFYQSGAVWRNERRPNARDDVDALRDYFPGMELTFPSLFSGRIVEVSAFGDARERDTGTSAQSSRRLDMSDLGTDLIRFAMDARPFFSFNELSRHFPNLPDRNTFITSGDYLDGIGVMVRGSEERILGLAPSDRLAIARFVLEAVETTVKKASVDHVGTREFIPEMLNQILTDRDIKIGVAGESGRSWEETELKGLEHIDLHQEDWHVFETSYGTDQEKYLIRHIHDNRDRLRSRFDEFYLIRNEKMVTIYSFDEGRAFEPDFLLFLRRNHGEDMVTVQVFIEPKMAKLAPAEQWKQDFLAQIAETSGVATLFQDRKYRIMGLPFYNTDHTILKGFQSEFDGLIEESTP